MLDTILFRQKTHLKRGLGFTQIPTLLYQHPSCAVFLPEEAETGKETETEEEAEAKRKRTSKKTQQAVEKHICDLFKQHFGDQRGKNEDEDIQQ
jgi:hypothetical protein